MTVTNESTPLHTANSKSTRVTEESSEAAAGAGYTQDDVIKLEANGHGVVEDDPDDDDDESPGESMISCGFLSNTVQPTSVLTKASV